MPVDIDWSLLDVDLDSQQLPVPEVDDAMTVCTTFTVLGAGVAQRFERSCTWFEGACCHGPADTAASDATTVATGAASGHRAIYTGSELSCSHVLILTCLLCRFCKKRVACK